MYLSPRSTSDLFNGLKRHITLMLHSAGSAIFRPYWTGKIQTGGGRTSLPTSSYTGRGGKKTFPIPPSKSGRSLRPITPGAGADHQLSCCTHTLTSRAGSRSQKEPILRFQALTTGVDSGVESKFRPELSSNCNLGSFTLYKQIIILILIKTN